VRATKIRPYDGFVMVEHEYLRKPNAPHGLSFDQRSVLLILGLSLRQCYEPLLRSDFDDRMRRALERLAGHPMETR
jgi:hypothetical protein